MARILVVDDDFSNADAIQMLLEEENFEVKSIHHSDLLEETVKDYQPDLIVMDILLDKGDGRELCSLLKRNSKTLSIPILLITAMLDWQARAKTSHADALMFKPFDYLTLTRKVHELLH